MKHLVITSRGHRVAIAQSSDEDIAGMTTAFMTALIMALLPLMPDFLELMDAKGKNQR